MRRGGCLSWSGSLGLGKGNMGGGARDGAIVVLGIHVMGHSLL